VETAQRLKTLEDEKKRLLANTAHGPKIATTSF
jgi:hypothetical protein